MNRLAPSDTPTGKSDCRDRPLQDLEAAARAAISAQVGIEISNEEWASGRGRLVEFMRILRMVESGNDDCRVDLRISVRQGAFETGGHSTLLEVNPIAPRMVRAYDCAGVLRG
jgi:hypothetical protein